MSGSREGDEMSRRRMAGAHIELGSLEHSAKRIAESLEALEKAARAVQRNADEYMKWLERFEERWKDDFGTVEADGEGKVEGDPDWDGGES